MGQWSWDSLNIRSEHEPHSRRWAKARTGVEESITVGLKAEHTPCETNVRRWGQHHRVASGRSGARLGTLSKERPAPRAGPSSAETLPGQAALSQRRVSTVRHTRLFGTGWDTCEDLSRVRRSKRFRRSQYDSACPAQVSQMGRRRDTRHGLAAQIASPSQPTSGSWRRVVSAQLPPRTPAGGIPPIRMQVVFQSARQ